MLSDKIKGKSALNARTFLHVRDKVHVQAVDASIDGKQAQIKPFIGEIFTYKKHFDPSEQWSLTWRHKTDMPRARIRSYNYREKTPIKAYVHHEGLSLVVKIRHLQVTVDVFTVKSHANHNVKQLSN